MPAPVDSLLFVLRILLLLARVEISLRREPLPATCARLGVRLSATDERPDGPAADLSPDQWFAVRRARRAVDRIAPRWPFGDTCLRRALVIAVLVRVHDPLVVIGVRRDPETRQIAAHAWVVVGGYSLDPTAALYATMERSSGTGPTGADDAGEPAGDA